MQGNKELVEILINKKADAYSKNTQRKTPFNVAQNKLDAINKEYKKLLAYKVISKDEEKTSIYYI